MGKKADVSIEAMRKEDLDRVMAIEEASFSMPWSRNLFLSEFRSPGVSKLLVALEAGVPARRIIGYLIYWLVEDEMHILNLAVAPKFRRQGIAALLVTSGLRRAYATGARRAFLEVRVSNTAAQKLYSALGFSGSGFRRDYYDEPLEDAVLMTLERPALEKFAKTA